MYIRCSSWPSRPSPTLFFFLQGLQETRNELYDFPSTNRLAGRGWNTEHADSDVWRGCYRTQLLHVWGYNRRASGESPRACDAPTVHVNNPVYRVETSYRLYNSRPPICVNCVLWESPALLWVTVDGCRTLCNCSERVTIAQQLNAFLPLGRKVKQSGENWWSRHWGPTSQSVETQLQVFHIFNSCHSQWGSHRAETVSEWWPKPSGSGWVLFSTISLGKGPQIRRRFNIVVGS